MPACPRCRRQNPGEAVECQACGALFDDGSVAESDARPSMLSSIVAVADLAAETSAPSGLGPPPTHEADGDLARQRGDLTAAWSAYQNALARDARSVPLLQKMVAVAEASQDAVGLSRCLATLSQVLSDPRQRADYMYRAAVVTRDGRKQPLKAAAGMEAALDLDPQRLDVFVAVTQLYLEAGDLDILEAAYRRMIERVATSKGGEVRDLSKLWRKLAALLAGHQRRFEDGVLAIDTAIALDPEDPKNWGTRYEIYAGWPGKTEETIGALTDFVTHGMGAADQVKDLRKLGALHLELGHDDGAFCCFRVLAFLGAATDKEAQFVEQLRRRIPRIPEATLTDAQWREAVLPAEFPHEMARLMALITPAVREKVQHELSTHEVSEKLNPKDPLLFNTLIGRVGKVFGLERPPDVYVKDGVPGIGLINGQLERTGLIADRSLLSGRLPQEVSFIVARMLALLRADFYLAGVCPASDLGIYVTGAWKFTDPDAPIPPSKDVEWVGKTLSGLGAAQQAELKALVRALLAANIVLDVSAALYWIDATANRLAFIIADDLEAAADAIARDTRNLGRASADERIDLLMRYAVSAPYLRLRRELGLAVG